MNPLISGFVHDALSRGVSRGDIARALQGGGWEAREINAALSVYVDSELPLPVPRKRVSASPREAFLFLMLYATLYTAAFSLGSVLFDLINLALPQAGEIAHRSIVSLRYGIASVVVAFPIFLFMCRVIARDSSHDPGQRISPVRRWLTYLTLFVAAVSIIADSITLIVRLLEGDITLRFGLKAAVVAILAGGAFLYYLGDLRRDEEARPAGVRSGSQSRLAFVLVITAVLATIGTGFWFAGSPASARLLVQDRQREQDLAEICRLVEQYYSNQGSLPESLAASDVNPATFIRHKTDPITGRPYMYQVVDTTHFTVGATFALPSEPGTGRTSIRAAGSASWNDTSFWKHGAGATTFTIDVKK